MLFAVSLHPFPRQTVTCGNNVDAKTSHRSTRGYTVFLQMHSEDDHGKNTHLCQSEYTISGARPDGGKIDPKTAVIFDDVWGRSIVFGFDGFTSDGNRVIATIYDGGDYASFNIIVYDLRTGSIELSEIPNSFLRRLGSCSVAELQVAGTTPDGFVVLATNAMSKCPQGQTWWRVKPGLTVNGVRKPSTPARLPHGATIEMLEPLIMSF